MTRRQENAQVTVLGLGPMGRALAGAFLENGHPTTVWNRTAGKADELVAKGARRAESAADAATDGDVVIVCVIDHAAVRAVVEPAAGVLKGRTLVNLTSSTPEDARAMASWAAGHDIDYLDGAIMTPTWTIGGPDATFLYAGPEPVYEAVRSILGRLGGTATYLGTDPGRAAAYDVALLDVFWTAMSGLVHAFALARAEDIAATDLAPLAKGIGGLLPGIIDEFARHLEGGEFPGDESNIHSAVAGMTHIVRASRARGIDATVLSAAETIARQAIDAGHGADGFSRLADMLGRRARSTT